MIYIKKIKKNISEAKNIKVKKKRKVKKVLLKKKNLKMEQFKILNQIIKWILKIILIQMKNKSNILLIFNVEKIYLLYII